MVDTDERVRNALIDNFSAYAEGIDTKNWEMVRSCFAAEVCLDYGPLSEALAEPDQPVPADDWIRQLQSVIEGFDTTRHTITNHRCHIGGASVCCRAYLAADHIVFSSPGSRHVAAADVVTVVGEYTNFYREVLGEWKIVRSRLAVDWTAGNIALMHRP